MSVPKCTNWLGHKFEARYSTKPPSESILATLDGNSAIVAHVTLQDMTAKTYEGDVCTRCGALVNRKE